jgi:hypothetical protein
MADSMDAISSGTIKAGLNLMSQKITVEIEAEDNRLRNKEAYETFADAIAQIANRADLDKARKGQMIHDTACRLQLKF